ncbi:MULTISPECIES: DUF2935 domain-containing protein [Clostridium]|uniref:DUF2935 domain-containing protein n=1 Tax=Clostridium aquiflavi TaxID=3073603 RepID=A0ABU1EJR6_9CLOT|nr:MULTISPECIES: DUF2935 domain-containing protein [unclassified Clostridium]MDR5588637.1 DUF2935 domain-containing protein [Clostridium sp. 5N-1]NFG60415.1 DUF2935 domain-containing protein [Clostridium botulinum]NFQ09942.1 DUF2935 domain-containing protein [Clostridium botulinum]
MLSSQKYVTLSLELHLFFGRIMKEHSLFLEAGFTPKNTKFSKEAENYKMEFEKLLLDTVKLSDGRVREFVIDSGEIFTDYTLSTEKKTQYYTGININSKITEMEKELKCENKKHIDSRTVNCVKKLNNRAIKLLNGLIDFKMKVLEKMLNCELFTLNYPLLIQHIIHEAKLYHSYICALENEEDIGKGDIGEVQLFWDQIMMEHALFIRGLLDPSEDELINTSSKFAKEYSDLIEKSGNITDMSMSTCINDTLLETIRLRDFKKAGTEGIIECKIKSIILPLLADHVLREANHYIRILKNHKN